MKRPKVTVHMEYIETMGSKGAIGFFLLSFFMHMIPQFLRLLVLCT